MFFLNGLISSNRMLGIDIGSSATKWIVLSLKNGQYLVEDYGIEHIPCMFGKDGIANEDIITNVLKSSLGKYKKNIKNIILSIPHSSVIRVKKTIAIDMALRPEEIEEVILTEITTSVPYPVTDIRYDYEILSIDNSNLAEVLLTITKKDIIDNRLHLMNQVGFEVNIVDTEAFAVERLFRYIMEGHSSNSFVVFDIGASAIKMYAIQNLELVFTDEQVLGNNYLTNSIKNFYHLDFDSAELVKIGQKVVDNYEQNILLNFKEVVGNNIQTMLQTFLSINGGNNVSEIIFIGGDADFAGLEDYLRQKFNINIQKINPFYNYNIGVSSNLDQNIISKDITYLFPCLGLALRNDKL